jgi:hypothetical protein
METEKGKVVESAFLLVIIDLQSEIMKERRRKKKRMKVEQKAVTSEIAMESMLMVTHRLKLLSLMRVMVVYPSANGLFFHPR